MHQQKCAHPPESLIDSLDGWLLLRVCIVSVLIYAFRSPCIQIRTGAMFLMFSTGGEIALFAPSAGPNPPRYVVDQL